MVALLAAALSALAFGGYQPSPLLPLDGAYVSPGGAAVSLAVAGDTLLYTDLRTGRLRQLAQTAPGRFAFGPGYLVQRPVQGTVEVAGGAVTVSRAGEPTSIAEALPLRREQVRFRNGRVTLYGKVTIPPGSGRRAGIVILHGSEPGDRDAADLYVNLFASLGLVVLSYDKRGVGDSGGVYVEAPTPSNVADLAGDAAAGFRLLAARPDVDPARTGFFGGSQAGWIIPRAAALAKRSAFAVIVSGPTMSTGEEDAFSTFTNDGETARAASARAIAKAMAKVRPGGFDPRRDLQRLQIPVLWLYGAQDKSEYAQQSVRILRALHRRQFTIRLFARADHFLLESAHGLQREVGPSRRFTPGLFPAIRTWIAGRKLSG